MEMKTKEEILDNKFKELGIRKGWTNESKQAVLDAMDEYGKINSETSDTEHTTNEWDDTKMTNREIANRIAQLHYPNKPNVINDQKYRLVRMKTLAEQVESELNLLPTTVCI